MVASILPNKFIYRKCLELSFPNEARGDKYHMPSTKLDEHYVTLNYCRCM